MPLTYWNLDGDTRTLMGEELDIDIAEGSLYISDYLTVRGREDWPDMLRDAARRGSDCSLAQELRQFGRLQAITQRRRPSGAGFYTARVPHNAAEVMAEGEFNRFYVRGVCRRALRDDVSMVVVYRAKAVASPRAESERKIGTAIDPRSLLADLRSSVGLEPALGIPAGPGSGLTIRLP